MKIFDYRVLYRSEAMHAIDDYFKLTREQREIFYNDGEWLPFYVLVPSYETKYLREHPVKFEYRLTYPLFLLVLLLMIIFSPICYIVYGQFSYPETKKPFLWVWNWGKKLKYF